MVCRHFGIHRNTFSKWLNLFDENNLHSLESRSQRPNTVREREANPVIDLRVVALRKKYPCWGKMKIKEIYKSAHTVVLHAQGLKRYILTCIDHYTKVGYAYMYKNHSSKNAEDFLNRMYYLLESKVENIHTDNGSEFHRYFMQAAKKLNLEHYWSRPRTPKDNPSLERFNRTLKEEFLRWGNYHQDPDIFNKCLTDWLVTYNAISPHESLGYLTPLKFAEKSMSMHTIWSSSTTT